MMNNKKGFTLMEILLAAMIVGVIGIALAALTTAAVREGGVGRTKVMLRQHLSSALRQLRQDILQSSGVIITTNNGVLSSMRLNQTRPLGPQHVNESIVYAFTPGTIRGAVDNASLTGGTITRNGELWLSNVKQIVQSGENPFISPSITLPEGYGAGSVLRIRIIVEVPTEPVVNDVVEEFFVLPNGFVDTSNE